MKENKRKVNELSPEDLADLVFSLGDLGYERFLNEVSRKNEELHSRSSKGHHGEQWRLDSNEEQRAQGVKSAKKLFELLRAADLNVAVSGYKTLSAEQEEDGDRDKYFAYLKTLLPKDRLEQLSPFLIDAPDFALMSNEGNQVLAWVESTSIKHLGPTFHSLPDHAREIDRHLPKNGLNARYFEPSYLVYEILDADHYDQSTGLPNPNSHHPRSIFVWAKVQTKLVEGLSIGSDRKYHMPLFRFTDDDGQATKLIVELRKF